MHEQGLSSSASVFDCWPRVVVQFSGRITRRYGVQYLSNTPWPTTNPLLRYYTPYIRVRTFYGLVLLPIRGHGMGNGAESGQNGIVERVTP